MTRTSPLKMKLILCVLGLWYGVAAAAVVDRQLLSYAPIPTDAYTPPVNSTTTTLLDLVKSRPELSNLSSMIERVPGVY
jgi:hypothetical protein